jgi:predicted nucleic acid-binding protein
MVAQLELYIDTNVLIDWIDPQRQNNRSKLVLQTVRDSSDLVAIVSPFTLMEAIEERQEATYLRSLLRRGFTLREIREKGPFRSLTSPQRIACFGQVQDFLGGLGSKVIIRPIDDPDFWTDSSHLVQTSSLSAPDAVHVSAAISSGCDAIVTGDRQLRQQVSKSNRLRRRLPLIFVGTEGRQTDFVRDFRATISELRQRNASRPRRRPPEEFRRLVSVVSPILGKSAPTPEFIEKFESELRSSARERRGSGLS